MHVVERVETYDRISRNRFVTRYAYHHGYFDGVEREFRGFGLVDSGTPRRSERCGPTARVPPTRRGIVRAAGAHAHLVPHRRLLDGHAISRQFANEYYRGRRRARRSATRPSRGSR